MSVLLVIALLGAPPDETSATIPETGGVVVDTKEGEVRFPARVQHPKGKPCIDAWGQRIQAFLGSEKAGGARSEFGDHFVFLAAVDTEEVYRGVVELGVNTKAHYSRVEGRKRAGRDFLQGDPVAIFVRWKERGRWVERRYEDFVREKVVVDGREVIKPWTPHFVFHGSGVIYKEGTGCIACPCDCPGGLIADDRNPIYEPKPTVRFDLDKAPPEGTRVEIRIRPIKGNEPSSRPGSAGRPPTTAP